MQEIKKRRIVIASVLKPVDETRMFEKIGLSLAKEYEVHIIGYPSASAAISQEVHIHPLKDFTRLSFQRVLSPWKILQKVLTLKPSLFIICTHELLLISVLAKWICRCKIIYDVQENYSRNILYTNAFPLILRPFLANYVRLKEWISHPMIDHYLLAENAYQNELSFVKRKATIIENKYKPQQGVSHVKTKNDGKIKLLFSGTLSESTGVFNAIDLATRLHHQDAAITLTIVGYCSLKKEHKKLLDEITTTPYVNLVGGDHLVPHPLIIQHIQNSDFGIIAYPENPATVNSIPTKLFEYLANELPILLINNPRWIALCHFFRAAIPFDPQNINAEEILQQMKKGGYYTTKPTHVLWENEEKKLLNLLKALKF